MSNDPSVRLPGMVYLRAVRAKDQPWINEIVELLMQEVFLYVAATMDLDPRHMLS